MTNEELTTAREILGKIGCENIVTIDSDIERQIVFRSVSRYIESEQTKDKMNEQMNNKALLKVFNRIREKYNWALKQEDILNPLSYAIYEVWKAVDKIEEDKTTNEEALKYAKNTIFCTGCAVNFGQMTSEETKEACDRCEHRQFFEVSIKALEKQIPKKMLKEHYSGYTLDVCPNCKTSFGGFGNINGYEYCPHCGQALDWSEE